MIEERSTDKGLDFGALRAAMEACDPEALVGFYAEDAELRVVHASLPDVPAFWLKGRERIWRYLRAVCDQPMTCSVQGGFLLGEGRIEFVGFLSYPSGVPISVATALTVKGGLIATQTDVVRRAEPKEGSEL